MQFSMEMVSRAEQLYCFDGHTLKEVSALTGVSLRALKRWSSSYGWVEKREEIGRSVDKAFAFLREIEANSRAGTSETSHAGGLSDKTAAEIRRKILGIDEETGELERRTSQNKDSFEESNMQAPVRGQSGANDGL
ncbi:MAG: hypothetical protein AB9866_20355 [Syntrophobacteraceae bacterium]